MAASAGSLARRRTRYAVRKLTATSVAQSADKTKNVLTFTFGTDGTCHLDQPGDSATWLAGIGAAYLTLAKNLRIGA